MLDFHIGAAFHCLPSSFSSLCFVGRALNFPCGWSVLKPTCFVAPPAGKHTEWFEVTSSWAKQWVSGAAEQAEPQLNPAHL